MATIKTTIRSINVKENVNEIYSKFSFDYIELTEVIILEKMNGDFINREEKIIINKNFIIEISNYNQ